MPFNPPFCGTDFARPRTHSGFIHHLAPQGMAGFVLTNGSMSSNKSGEGDIRRALIEADLVDCMVALPGQLFSARRFRFSLVFVKIESRAHN